MCSVGVKFRLKIARWILRKPTHLAWSQNWFSNTMVSVSSAYTPMWINFSMNHTIIEIVAIKVCFLTNCNESAPLNGINAIAKELNWFGFDVYLLLCKNTVIIKSLLIISTTTKMHMFILKITWKSRLFILSGWGPKWDQLNYVQRW